VGTTVGSMGDEHGIEVRVYGGTPAEAPFSAPFSPAEPISFLSCVGCGALEAPAECTNQCDDHRMHIVRGAEHAPWVAAAAAREAQIGPLTEAVAALARAEPAVGGAGAGAGERAYGELQRRARAALRAAPDAGDPPAAEAVEAWHCTACGRIEAPQPCLGVCLRVREDFVLAEAQEAAVARALAFGDRTRPLRAILGRLAWTRPREGQWERSLRVLQDEARAALGS
jgi:hypothetical protein